MTKEKSHANHHVDDKLVDFYDLTRPLDGSVRTYGNDATRLYRDVNTIDGLQRMSSLSISPHSVTHIDLPGCLPFRLGDKGGRGGETRFSASDEISSVISMNCLLIDFSDYSEIIYDAMKEAKINELPSQEEYCWTEGQIERILDKLRISESDVNCISEVENYVIIFHTGWRRFAPVNGDLHEFGWIPWHPYLDHSAIKYLLSGENGKLIKGIGCDIYGLDNPLRYLSALSEEDEEMLLPEVKELIKKENEQISSVSIEEEYWSLHIAALDRADWKFIIEQMYIPREIFLTPGNADCAIDRKNRRGKLTLLPLKFNKSKDVLIVSAFFSAEG